MPETWRDLQDFVARILRESGVHAETERTIDTARGEVEIDVWAHDDGATPAQTYVVECKHWKQAVPKSVVHGFRTVIVDSGAHWGAIVSPNGFQSGAYEATRYSNVRLLTWNEFQALYAAKWYERFFLPYVSDSVDALVEYTEPINSRIFGKADSLTDKRKKQFVNLRKQYAGLGLLCMLFRVKALGVMRFVLDDRLRGDPALSLPQLPLRDAFSEKASSSLNIPDTVLDATHLRELLQAVVDSASQAIEEFDEVFGHRA